MQRPTMRFGVRSWCEKQEHRMQSRQCLTHRPGSGMVGSLRTRQLWHFMSVAYHKLTEDITSVCDTHKRDKRNKTMHGRNKIASLAWPNSNVSTHFASAPFHLPSLSVYPVPFLSTENTSLSMDYLLRICSDITASSRTRDIFRSPKLPQQLVLVRQDPPSEVLTETTKWVG